MSALTVLPGGSGTTADAELVRAELSGLPTALVERMSVAGVHIVACRNAVTDVAAELRGKVPRNWCRHPELGCEANGHCRRDPADCPTWDRVPGAYLPAHDKVVVATIGGQVPPYGTGHGSISLAVHESLHGADYQTGKPSKKQRFRDAWQADYALLGGDYFTNTGAGLEESYAESAAQEFGLDASRRGRWPALAAYWAASAAPAALSADLAERVVEENAVAGPVTMGFGVIDESGNATLFLRAEGPNGEHGHGAVAISFADLPPLVQARITAETLTFGAGERTFPVPENFAWPSAGE